MLAMSADGSPSPVCTNWSIRSHSGSAASMEKTVKPIRSTKKRKMRCFMVKNSCVPCVASPTPTTIVSPTISQREEIAVVVDGIAGGERNGVRADPLVESGPGGAAARVLRERGGAGEEEQAAEQDAPAHGAALEIR